MLKIRDLSVTYGDNTVFNNVSIDLEIGKINGFVGSNGSGKTTFFNVLYRFIKNFGGKYTGQIELNEENLKRSSIAYFMQDNYFYPNITGREYLSIISSSHNNKIVFELNNVFELPLDQFIETYSTGMKKKLAILGVLKLDRKIYIFDEPYSGLDVEGVYILDRFIQRLSIKGKTILLSSHILDVLRNRCDNFHFIHSGSIHHFKDIDQFSYSKMLSKKYDDIIDKY